MAGASVDIPGQGLIGPRSSAPNPQLTIFYSGTVNVYNNIPADKAHAIMLLLNSNHTTGRDNSTNKIAEATVANSFKAPTPPQSPYTIASLDKKPQIVCKRSQAELPFARKASLARFLEKRKDRVQVKQAGPEEEENSGEPCKKPKLTPECSDH